RIEIALQIAGRQRAADVGTRAERDALLLHEREAAVEKALLHLELGDAVAQETADPVGAFEHRHPMPRASELIRGGEPRRTRAHDGDLLAGALLRRLGGDPAGFERALHDRDLDGL